MTNTFVNTSETIAEVQNLFTEYFDKNKEHYLKIHFVWQLHIMNI